MASNQPPYMLIQLRNDPELAREEAAYWQDQLMASLACEIDDVDMKAVRSHAATFSSAMKYHNTHTTADR